MASNPARQNEFLKVSINDYADKLSNEDRNKFYSMRKSILEGSNKHSADFGQFMSDKDTLNKVMAKTAIYSKQGRADFSLAVQEKVIAWQRANNTKNAPQDVVEKIAMDQARMIVLDKSKIPFFDTKKRAYELSSEDVNKITYEVIPDQEKKVLEEYLTKQYGSVDKAKMLELYKGKLMKAARR
jgi:hypothetical protein